MEKDTEELIPSPEANILNQLKEWLAQGCSIRATDPSKPFLYPLEDGTWEGGLTISHPSKKPEEILKDSLPEV